MTSAPHPSTALAAQLDRRASRWLALLAAVLGLLLAAPFLAGRIYGFDDLTAFHLPTRFFYAECLARGDSFAWCPQLFGGLYLVGEGQVGAYHPLHLLLYRWLNFSTAFGLDVLASYPLLFAGVWRWLRRQQQSGATALFGALVVTGSGFQLLHFMHINALAIFAHLPWQLLALETLALDRAPHRRLWGEASLALLTASQLLLGYPQYTWFCLLVVIAYAAYLVLSLQARGNFWSLGRALALALLLSAVQLATTADALADSTRGQADRRLPFTGSWHPANGVQLVAPYLLTSRVVGQNTHELTAYLGAVPTLLVVWLLLRGRSAAPWPPLAVPLLVLAAVALLLALGEHGPLYVWQTYLPLVGKFRFPCRYLSIVSFAAGLLAALAFGQLLAEHARRRLPDTGPVRISAAVWLLPLASLLATLTAPLWVPHDYLAPWWCALAGPLLYSAAAAALWAVERGWRGAVPCLLLLCAVDLGVYGLSYAPWRQTATLAELLARVPAPPGPADTRAVAQVRAPGHPARVESATLALVHRPRWDGYAGLEPARQLRYDELPALRLASVSWVGRDTVSSRITGLAPHDPHWLRVPETFPQARFVGHIFTSRQPRQDLTRVDLRTTALVAPTAQVPPLDGQATGEARLVEQRPGRVTLAAQTTGRLLLVTAQPYHRGWQATVSGQRQPVLRVNGDFLGVVVPRGTHEVELRFAPDSLRYGLMVTWATILVALPWYAVRFRKLILLSPDLPPIS